MTQQVLHLAAAVHASSSSVISRSVWKLFEHTTYIHPNISSAIYFYASVTYKPFLSNLLLCICDLHSPLGWKDNQTTETVL